MIETTRRTHMLAFLYFTIILSWYASAAPQLDSITGNISNGQVISLSGSGFGTKSQAAPFRSSYDNPTTVMNFQDTGNLDSNYWTTPENAFDNNFAEPQNNMKRVNKSTNYYIEVQYRDEGTGSGVRIYNLPMTGKDYFAWWDYFETGFNCSNMATGAAAFKYIYTAAGGHPHNAIQVFQDSRIHGQATGGIAGDTNEEQNNNLNLPFGGGFYARPLSWITDYELPIGQWFFVEVMYNMSTAPDIQDGWYELRINNQRIFRANNADLYDSGYVNDPDFRDFSLGGNYGWYGGNDIYYRYYGDVYLDSTFQRVIVCENSTYEDCRHIELQVPSAWTEESISVFLNQGSFNEGDKAYIYVKDENNAVSNGYEITFGEVPSACGAVDTSGNDVVESDELRDFIDQWKNGDVTITNLIVAISRKKNGC